MQDFLTVLIEVFATIAIAIFTLDFCSMLCECWQHAALPSQAMPMSAPASQPKAELKTPSLAESAPIATISTLQPVADTRPSKAKPKQEWKIAQAEVTGAALAQLSAVKLRQQCSKSGVKWRNAHGRGRHLTKNEMIARLTA